MNFKVVFFFSSLYAVTNSHNVCSEMHLCPFVSLRYDLNKSTSYAFSKSFLNGRQNKASLFDDFTDVNRGTSSWQTFQSKTIDYYIPYELNSFHHRLVAGIAPHAPELKVLLNTTICSIKFNFSILFGKVTLYDAEPICIFNFQYFYLSSPMQIFGVLPAAILSRNSIVINNTVLVQPGQVGSYTNKDIITLFNPFGSKSQGAINVLFTIQVKPNMTRTESTIYVISTRTTNQCNLNGYFTLIIENIETGRIDYNASFLILKQIILKTNSFLGNLHIYQQGTNPSRGVQWTLDFLYDFPAVSVGKNMLTGCSSSIKLDLIRISSFANITGSFLLNVFECGVRIPLNSSEQEVGRLINENLGRKVISVSVKIVECFKFSKNYIRLWAVTLMLDCSNYEHYCYTNRFPLDYPLSKTDFRKKDIKINVSQGSLLPTFYPVLVFGHQKQCINSYITGLDVNRKIVELIEASINRLKQSILRLSTVSWYKNYFFVRRNLTIHMIENMLNNLSDLYLSKEKKLVYFYISKQTQDSSKPRRSGHHGIPNFLENIFFVSGVSSLGGEDGGVLLLSAINDVVIKKLAEVHISGEDCKNIATSHGGNGGNGGLLKIFSFGVIDLFSPLQLLLLPGKGCKGRIESGIRGKQGMIYTRSKSFYVEKHQIHAIAAQTLVDSKYISYRIINAFSETVGTIADGALELRFSKGCKRHVRSAASYPLCGIKADVSTRSTRLLYMLHHFSFSFRILGDNHSTKQFLFCATLLDSTNTPTISLFVKNGTFYLGNCYEEYLMLDVAFKKTFSYKVDVFFHVTEKWYDIRINDVTVAANRTFQKEIFFVAFLSSSSSQINLDNVYFGVFEGIFFRCPKLDVSSGKYRYQVSRYQNYLSTVKLNPEYFDENATPNDGKNLYKKKKFVFNHISNRDIYKNNLSFISEILLKDEARSIFLDDSKEIPKKIDGVETENSYFHTVDLRNMFDFKGKQYWIAAMFNLGLNQTEILLRGTNLYDHYVGSIVICEKDTNSNSFYNKGQLLNFVNISYTGGVPYTTRLFRKRGNVTSLPSNDTKFRNLSILKKGYWRGKLLTAMKPQILHENQKFLLVFIATDGFKLDLLSNCSYLELGIAGMASSSSLVHPFSFMTGNLIDNKLTFDIDLAAMNVSGNKLRFFLIRTLHTTVNFMLPRKVINPVWNSVKDCAGKLDFSLNYHRGIFHEGYNDFHDINMERLRFQTKDLKILLLKNIKSSEDKYKSNKHLIQAVIDQNNSTVTNYPWTTYVEFGLGEPVVTSRYINPEHPVNNAFRTRYRRAKAQNWSQTCKKLHIKDNQPYTTKQDGYVGVPDTLFKWKTSFKEVILLNENLTGFDKTTTLVFNKCNGTVLKTVFGKHFNHSYSKQKKSNASYEVSLPVTDQSMEVYFQGSEKHCLTRLIH